MGWAQTINGMATLRDSAELTAFFFPSDFKFQEGKKIFLPCVADHPESLSKQAAIVLTNVLSEKNILQIKILPVSNAGIEVIPSKK
jgi:hypothetical protein